MINTKSWKPSNVVGTVLIFAGVLPFVLWVLDYINVIRPGEEPLHWGVTVMTVVPIGLGLLLVGGKGSSISEAVLAWMPGFMKRRDDD